MKKLGIYFMMLAMMAVTFVGCGDKDDPNPPVITMPTKIVINVDANYVPSMEDVMVSVNSPDEDLTAIEVYVQMGTFKYAVEDVELEKKQTAWTKTYTLADFPVAEFGDVTGTLEFCIKATTANTEANRSATIEINFEPVIPEDTPLTPAVEFTLGRPGHDGYPATAMGVTWASNVDGNTAKFTGTFVMLANETVYNNLETVEALEELFGTEAKVTEFTAKSDANFHPQYFIVQDGATLRLVKMTNLKFAEGANKAWFMESH